jgi:hypothetical protein
MCIRYAHRDIQNKSVGGFSSPMCPDHFWVQRALTDILITNLPLTASCSKSNHYKKSYSQQLKQKVVLSHRFHSTHTTHYGL